MNRTVVGRMGWMVLFGLLAGCVVPGICTAEGRAKSFEASGMGSWVTGGTLLEGEEGIPGFDSFFMYGGQIGYNVTDNLNINTDIQYGTTHTPNVEETVDGIPVSGRFEGKILAWMVNVDYNFLTGPLTPFVTGGVGLVHKSADLTVSAEGLSESVSLDSSTDLGWNIGAGGRWDITNNIFAKVYYRMLGDKGDYAHSVAFTVGWMFK